jgi:hypothetical protein
VDVVVQGLGYSVPPIVQFSGGNGNVPSEELSSLRIPFIPAAAVARLNVFSVAVVNGGSGYSATPTVTLVGGLSFNDLTPGLAATVTATVVGGVITGFTVTSQGGNYTSVPQVVITDPTGTGAEGTAEMQVANIILTRPGKGYTSPPTVTLVPWFQVAFPSAGGSQAAPLRNLFTETIQTPALTQVRAALPVVT